MSVEFDIYAVTSGPYQMGFAADQIEAVKRCPPLALPEGAQPGVLGIADGLRVVNPGCFWGDAGVPQQPQYLLVVRSGLCALAVDSCQLQRVLIDPPPPVLAGSGMIFGVAHTTRGTVLVFDLAYVPLVAAGGGSDRSSNVDAHGGGGTLTAKENRNAIWRAQESAAAS